MFVPFSVPLLLSIRFMLCVENLEPWTGYGKIILLYLIPNLVHLRYTPRFIDAILLIFLCLWVVLLLYINFRSTPNYIFSLTCCDFLLVQHPERQRATDTRQTMWKSIVYEKLHYREDASCIWVVCVRVWRLTSGLMKKVAIIIWHILSSSLCLVQFHRRLIMLHGPGRWGPSIVQEKKNLFLCAMSET